MECRPVNAMALSMLFTLCLTSIAIGSSVAYGIFVSLNVSGLVTSYIICIACKCAPTPLSQSPIHSPTPRYPPLPPHPHRPAPLPLLPRPHIRHSNQRRRAGFPGRLLGLPVRARGAAPRAGGDELELCDLGRCAGVFYGLLLGVGEGEVSRA